MYVRSHFGSSAARSKAQKQSRARRLGGRAARVTGRRQTPRDAARMAMFGASAPGDGSGPEQSQRLLVLEIPGETRDCEGGPRMPPDSPAWQVRAVVAVIVVLQFLCPLAFLYHTGWAPAAAGKEVAAKPCEYQCQSCRNTTWYDS